jgi:hypothetical protein
MKANMDLVILVTFSIGFALIAALWVVVRRIGSAGRTLPVTAEWIDELSMERYRPMLRLLGEEDLRFLRAQPGFTPRMAARLRAQRCQIFRGYLRSLSTDFGRVCGAIKLLMLQSRRDRPDLAVVLVRSQMIFAMSMLLVYCRLALYRCGICGVDVSSLVQTFDLMRVELRQLVPASVSLGA